MKAAADKLGRHLFDVRLRLVVQAQAIGIKADDRRRHIAIVGKTGMGKSTLLERLIISDMQAGRGVGLVDPHGDLADAVLAVGPQRAPTEGWSASCRSVCENPLPLAAGEALQRNEVLELRFFVSAARKLFPIAKR